MQNQDKKIIAIDPGYDRCGVAIVSETDGKPVVIFSDCITSTKSDDHYHRLADIFKQLESLIKEVNIFQTFKNYLNVGLGDYI